MINDLHCTIKLKASHYKPYFGLWRVNCLLDSWFNPLTITSTIMIDLTTFCMITLSYQISHSTIIFLLALYFFPFWLYSLNQFLFFYCFRAFLRKLWPLYLKTKTFLELFSLCRTMLLIIHLLMMWYSKLSSLNVLTSCFLLLVIG